ncbi:MAG: class I SAM-dependent methyltransferase, partial [Campylobacteraceae bacterium]|nr:class I SAM-dependent methyltransferase [Campylobacteraceae bacterium]
MKTLDLYAKIESMIGFYDEYEELYSSYWKLLSNFKIDKIIDIGCGNGKLLKLLQECKYSAFGIDKSPAMIAIAKKLKVDVSTQELNDFQEESFDCALAVADVLNYMKTDELNVFFKKVSRVLKKDGYFLADINTQEGFELADGVLVRDEKEKFLSVESFFKDNILT